MTNKIEVKWSGTSPAKCVGRWKIFFNGIELKIPEKIARNHMNTEGWFSNYPSNDDADVFQYPDGFRILCMNCNFATRFKKECPHKRSQNG